MNEDPNDPNNPNKPYSVARIAIWSLGIVSLAAVIGLIFEGNPDAPTATSLRSVVQTSIGALAAVAASRTMR